MAYSPEYFNGLLTIPDDVILQGHTAVEDYIENWTSDPANWPRPETVSVSPIFDGDSDKTIILGEKLTDQDWENK